jgi:uncharacterized protein (TIGR02996 family)
MTDEQALLSVVSSHPDEVTPRLMLADLLTEQGREKEAEGWRRLPHRSSPFASLVGRTVTEVKLNDDTLTLLTNDGPFSYLAMGDCCSVSWFYRVLGAENLIGQTVVAVAEGKTDDIDPDDGLARQECDEAYGYCLLTAKGACEVTFRNSSNGYYGGWLEVVRRDAVGDDGHTVVGSWVHPPAMKCGQSAGCGCGKCFYPTEGGGQ